MRKTTRIVALICVLVFALWLLQAQTLPIDPTHIGRIDSGLSDRHVEFVRGLQLSVREQQHVRLSGARSLTDGPERLQQNKQSVLCQHALVVESNRRLVDRRIDSSIEGPLDS